MRTELRPLDLGEILDRTFQIYRSFFSTFFGVAMFGAVFTLVWQTILTFVLRSLNGGHVPGVRLALLTSALQIPGIIISLVVFGVVYAAMVFNVAAIYRGEPTGVGRMLRAAAPDWFRLARTMSLAYLISFGPFVIAVSAMALVAQMGAARGIGISGPNNTTYLTGLIGLSFIVLVPLALWLCLRYSLSNAVCAYEKTNARKSLKRSIMLIKGMKRRMLVLFLIGGAVALVAGLIETIPTWFMHLRTVTHQPLWAVIYTLFGQFVLGSLISPIFGIGIALFYFDARIRKEGLDIEWSLDSSQKDGERLSVAASGQEFPIAGPVSG